MTHGGASKTWRQVPVALPAALNLLPTCQASASGSHRYQLVLPSWRSSARHSPTCEHAHWPPKGTISLLEFGFWQFLADCRGLASRKWAAGNWHLFFARRDHVINLGWSLVEGRCDINNLWGCFQRTCSG